MQNDHSQSSSSSSSNSDPANLVVASQITPTCSIQSHLPQNVGMETEGIGMPPASASASASAATNGISSFAGMRISSGLPFPFKLHAMLDDAAAGGYETIVSWSGDNGFLVHDKDAFVETVIPKYFSSQTKYRSFQRLLNMWGFQRSREGPRKGAYYHERYFRRGNSSLCGKMKCEKIKKKPAAAAAAAKDVEQHDNDSAAALASSSEIPNHHGIMAPLPKILEKQVATFDEATEPGVVDLAAKDAAHLPSFEDTFGDIVKQIIPVEKSSKSAAAPTPQSTTTSPAPLPTYTDLFEDRQFHEVSKGDKIARVYGPGNQK